MSAGLPAMLPQVGGMPQVGPPRPAVPSPQPPAPPPATAAGPGMPPAVGGMSMQQMLLFLAGMGFGPLVQSIEKLKKPPGATTHKAGVRAEAAANPAMAMNPMLAQIVAQKMRAGGGGTPGVPA